MWTSLCRVAYPDEVAISDGVSVDATTEGFATKSVQCGYYLVSHVLPASSTCLSCSQYKTCLTFTIDLAFLFTLYSVTCWVI